MRPHPSWRGAGVVLRCPGGAREVSLASELGRCQAPGTWVTVSCSSWGVFRGALSGARVTLWRGGRNGVRAVSIRPPPLLLPPRCVTLDE